MHRPAEQQMQGRGLLGLGRSTSASGLMVAVSSEQVLRGACSLRLPSLLE